MTAEQERIQKLETLLAYALEHATFADVQRTEDAEYDFCRACGEADWDHKADCKADDWKIDAHAVLKQNE